MPSTIPFCPGLRVSGFDFKVRCAGTASNSIFTGSADVLINCITLIFFSVFFTFVNARWLLSNLIPPTANVNNSSTVFSCGITSPLIVRTTGAGFVLAYTEMVLLNGPGLSLGSYIAVTLPFAPIGIGSLVHSGVVQPHDATTF